MKHIETPAARLTAKSILRSFQNSRKRHLLITGSRSRGKSTLFHELCCLLSPKEMLPGITTCAVPGKHVLLRENLPAEGSHQQRLIGRFSPPEFSAPGEGNRMEPVEEGFLLLGIPALRRAADSHSVFVTIDELGYLENACPAFQQTVFQLLEEKRVLAVLRRQDTPFLTALRQREDVFLYDLDEPVASIGCIIMASGMSKRFGSNKLFADFHGAPMMQSVLTATSGSLFAARLTVTRHKQAADLCTGLDIPVLLHDQPLRSQAVALGVEWMLHRYGDSLKGLLFCPADQPLLTHETLEALCLSFTHAPNLIWRLGFGGCQCGLTAEDTPVIQGSPVLFPCSYAPQLSDLPAGKGGSFLAKKYPEQVRIFPAQDACELWDADTPQDFARLLSVPLTGDNIPC